MSCQEARSILAALSIPEDRLAALQYVKRFEKLYQFIIILIKNYYKKMMRFI